MAKIEEITALLIDELELFQKTVKELKEESIQLQKTKLTVNTENVEAVFNGYNKELKLSYNYIAKELNIIQNKLKEKGQIPKWFILYFMTISLVLSVSIILNFHFNNNNAAIESEAFRNGQENIESHIQQFFDSNPTSLKKYNNWLDKN